MLFQTLHLDHDGAYGKGRSSTPLRSRRLAGYPLNSMGTGSNEGSTSPAQQTFHFGFRHKPIR